jgi:hypothetical protein
LCNADEDTWFDIPVREPLSRGLSGFSMNACGMMVFIFGGNREGERQNALFSYNLSTSH